MTTTVNVAVDVDLPSGLAAQNISLRFDLSGVDTEDDTVIAPLSLLYNFATGAGSVDLWVNSEGAESTFYTVALIHTLGDAYGREVRVSEVPLGGIALGEAASYSLAERLRNSVIPGGGGSAEQALYDALLAARDAAATSQAAAATSATNAANSATSAAASSAAAGAASGRLEVATFAELATVFGYSATGGRRAVTAGDRVRLIDIGAAFLVLASGASSAHLDYTGSGGVKLDVLPGPLGYDVRALGVVGDGVTDDGPAFVKAAQLGTYVSFIVPEANYLVNSTIDILTGQHWYFAGATISTTSEAGPIFRANGVSDWAMMGNLDLVGTLTTAATVSTAIGVQITNGKRYRMQGITARLFKGDGFLVDGTTTGGTALRGDRGQWTDCSAHQNTTGIEFAPGAGAEYVTVSNFTASGNALGVAVDAGNVTFLGGNIVDNTNGIFLTGVGGNNCHGIFDGVNINHNTQSNIKADGVTRGHTFTGCHIYGNASGSQGNIWFLNSRGILIQGGIIDAWIYNDLGAGSVAGINRVQGAYLPTNYSGSPLANTTLQSNDGGLGNLEVLDLWTYTGPASINDAAPVYVRATRGASTQALTSGSQTVLIFNSKATDKKNAYNTTTGVFTAPASGVYRVSLAAHITGTGLSGAFGSARVAGSAIGYFNGSQPSTTLSLVGGTLDVTMTEGQTLEVTAQVTGTSPVLAVNTSRLNIELLR